MATNSGAAYVFDRNGSTWQQQTILVANDNDPLDKLGSSISVSGNYLLAGATGDDSGGSNTGAAYVFQNTGLQGWIQQEKLKASDAQSSDQFGSSVHLSGFWAVVGALSEDEGGFSAGAAYLFNRSPCGVWSERDKIIADDASPNAIFGSSVQLEIRTLSFGFPGEPVAHLTVLSGAPGVNAAYWFEGEIPAYVSGCTPRRE